MERKTPGLILHLEMFIVIETIILTTPFSRPEGQDKMYYCLNNIHISGLNPLCPDKGS